VKFLLRGKCLGLALRLVQEGNSVMISDPFSKNTGKGLVDITEYEQGMEWADVVIFDINDGDLPEEAETLRKRGKLVVGSSKFAGDIENDRKIGADIAREAGIRVEPFYSFEGKTAFEKAREFVTTQNKEIHWVWKSNDSSPEDPPTYVGSDVETFDRMLIHYQAFYEEKKRTPSFILTKKVEGLEVSTEGWFNGRQFFLANHTIEKNRLFNNDLGPKTGCSGCTVWADESRLWHKLIPGLAKALAGKYCGPVDVNAIIEKESNEPVFLEFTPRFGYDALYAFMELFQGEMGGLLYALAKQQLVQGQLREGFASTIRLYIPPYPHDSKYKTETLGVPIVGYDPNKYSPHVAPCDVMLDDDYEVIAVGAQLFSISDVGSTVKESFEKAYQRVKKIEIPEMGYRTDLASVTQKCYDDLIKTNWFKNLGSKRKLTFNEVLANGR
jgi:phosphoribosylamine-glycine ligase